MSEYLSFKSSGSTVGLFGKKKQDESQVTLSHIQQTMNAPEIPADQPTWFKSSAVDLTLMKILSPSALLWPDSWVNIETAAIFVGTRIPEPCEECSDVNSCEKCGKNPTNYYKIMTANRDCDVLIWNLASNATTGNYVADGAFAFFDPSVYSTFDTSDGFNFSSQKLSSVELGQLEVKDIGDDTGTLFFGDANGAIDENFFFSGLRLLAGRYRVFAFIGYTTTGELAPQALGVFGAGFDDLLKTDLKTSITINDEIRAIITGDDTSRVLARFGNNQEYLAERNAELKQNGYPIPESWSYQLSFEADPEGRLSQVLSGDFEAGALLEIGDALRLRGKRTLSKKILDAAASSNNLGEVDPELFKFLLHLARTTEVGFNRPAQFRISAILKYDQARELRTQGKIAAADKTLEESARNGLPNALASLTWFQLKEGKYRDGIETHERYTSGTHQVPSFETANCDSNYALLKLAQGCSVKEALSIWEPNLRFGHPETIFFSAMVLDELGERSKSQALLEHLTWEQWAELEVEFKVGQATSTGWFVDWCVKSDAFLQRVK